MKKLLCLIIVLIMAFCGALVYANLNYPAPTQDDLLYYVGEGCSLPVDYKPELTRLYNDEYVSSEMYPELQRMFDDMRSEGVYPIVGSGYRSYETQEKLRENKISALVKSKRITREQAEKEVETVVADPGESEHQLGLGIDINGKKNQSTNRQVYNWLSINAYKYGFICRYPEDKTEITGISYEPWHYRYVGHEAAKAMHDSGECLEEYLGVVPFLYNFKAWVMSL